MAGAHLERKYVFSSSKCKKEFREAVTGCVDVYKSRGQLEKERHSQNYQCLPYLEGS